jgi:hypothetical protein
MGYCEHLKNMLRPLKLYELESGLGAAELAAEGGELDAVSGELDAIEREMLIPTAVDSGLERYETLLPYTPSYVTLEDRRRALSAMLRVDECSFTQEGLNSTLSGCGITAAAEETGVSQQVRVSFPGSRGMPAAFDALKERIEALLPCHLDILYYIVYPTWSELEGWFPTWTDFESHGFTWDELERYGG